jgi:hypothetical protein
MRGEYVNAYSPFFPRHRRTRMLKRDITYEDGEGNTVTETFYFNLTAKELVSLVSPGQENVEEAIKLFEGKDFRDQVLEFDKFVLASYGIRSEDRKRFIKNDQIREEFADSFAYDTLFMELATDEKAASIFIQGIIPKTMKEEVLKLDQLNQAKTVPLPPGPREAS